MHIVGARPNFMKLAPLYKEISKSIHSQKVIHTGQHYDALMSDVFFEQLQIPNPDYYLGIGSGSHTQQTAKTMLAVEEILLKDRPDMMIVYGDVNSTLAAALVCCKMQIPIAHVEAGLRSKDRTMPEELNRILTDSVADILLTPSQDGNENLLREGVDAHKIHLVGNIMMDTLVQALDIIEKKPQLLSKSLEVLEAIQHKPYILSTVHRPSNVDKPDSLQLLFNALSEISSQIDVILPLHPRTKKQLEEANILQALPDTLHIIEPLGYFDFIYLQKNATCILTDSGGVQEESSYLKTPCLTLRKNTERPITIDKGTNELVGDDYDLLKKRVNDILKKNYKKGEDIPLWDGKTAKRILRTLENFHNQNT
jgi:UDP-N-acetylglucosamine 2-epimerase (non-hydrolysing)